MHRFGCCPIAFTPKPPRTPRWVPLLFGVAGLILGVAYPLLDEAFGQPSAVSPGLTPSWGKVLLCISLFVTQYHLSAVLEQPLLGEPIGVQEQGVSKTSSAFPTHESAPKIRSKQAILVPATSSCSATRPLCGASSTPPGPAFSCRSSLRSRGQRLRLP